MKIPKHKSLLAFIIFGLSITAPNSGYAEKEMTAIEGILHGLKITFVIGGFAELATGDKKSALAHFAVAGLGITISDALNENDEIPEYIEVEGEETNSEIKVSGAGIEVIDNFEKPSPIEIEPDSLAKTNFIKL